MALGIFTGGTSCLSTSQRHRPVVVYSACGPRFAIQGPSVERAVPPRWVWASTRRTSVAPASAHAMLAIKPAMPPPTIVIGVEGVVVRMSRRGMEPGKGSRPLHGVQVPDDGWSPVVRRAQRGDPIAFDDLIRRLSPYVSRVCGAVALGYGDDAMQETFIAVLRGIGGLREPEAIVGWVRRIAVRESVHVAQKAGRTAPVDPLAPGIISQLVAETPDPATVLDVRKTLESLTPAHRAVLVLRDLEGWNERDVADALSVAPGTAKSRLARARAAFAERWSA